MKSFKTPFVLGASLAQGSVATPLARECSRTNISQNTAAIALTSYEVPQLFDVKPTSSPTSGVTGVVVEGKGFGSFAKDGTINQVQVLFDGVVLPNNNRP